MSEDKAKTRDKKKELNEIMKKYDSSVQEVYKQVLSQEKQITNIKKAQLKNIINEEIMKQVQKDDH